MLFLTFSYEIFGIIFLFVIALLAIFVRIVPEKTIWIIERKKQFHRKLKTGIHFIVPFLDKIGNKISIVPFNQELFFQGIMTKDNQAITLKLNCTCQIEDPTLYSSNNISTIIVKERIAFLTNQKTLTEMRNNVETFNDELYLLLAKDCIQYGLKLLKINIYYE